MSDQKYIVTEKDVEIVYPNILNSFNGRVKSFKNPESRINKIMEDLKNEIEVVGCKFYIMSRTGTGEPDKTQSTFVFTTYLDCDYMGLTHLGKDEKVRASKSVIHSPQMKSKLHDFFKNNIKDVNSIKIVTTSGFKLTNIPQAFEKRKHLIVLLKVVVKVKNNE